jgi:sec-independent protein translocase protein TatA
MNVGDLFDSPLKIAIVAAVIIVLFGSKKLPDAARSLGRSMRILKAEVGSLHEDEPVEATALPGSADQQGQIDALQQQIRDLQAATGRPANAARSGGPA